jgi:hypothetical protein
MSRHKWAYQINEGLLYCYKNVEQQRLALSQNELLEAMEAGGTFVQDFQGCRAKYGEAEAVRCFISPNSPVKKFSESN